MKKQADSTASYKLLFLSIIIVLIDRITKLGAVSAHWSTLELNYGWFGGTLSHSHVLIRIGILAGYYCAFCVLLLSFWKRIRTSSFQVQVALVFFFSGMTSNLIDRMAFGYVIDFFPISWGGLKYTFNSADIFQWLGVLVLLRGGWWRKEERRVKIFVNQKLQLRLFFRISLVFLGFSTAITTLILILLREVLHDPGLISSLIFVIGTYGFLFEAILFSVLLAETARWLGPFHAFINFIEFMDQRPASQRFKLRSSDEFRELEKIAQKLLKSQG